MTIDVSPPALWWLWPEFRNEPQNLLEYLSWNGDLGHLMKVDLAAVPHYA
jgi:hypothetical protein